MSTASLVVGVAAAGSSYTALRTAGFAAVVAGAMSMAAGEYVSVSSQRDVERSDLELERQAIADNPDAELAELARIYEGRGLSPATAQQVAFELHAHDAFASHARDELGLESNGNARPLQAALTSAIAFVLGALFPLIAVLSTPTRHRITTAIAVALCALCILGVLGAKAGGANLRIAATRILLWGGLAMAVTFAIGKAVGTAL